MLVAELMAAAMLVRAEAEAVKGAVAAAGAHR